jgi:DNA polymerase-3 subunit delta'
MAQRTRRIAPRQSRAVEDQPTMRDVLRAEICLTEFLRRARRARRGQALSPSKWIVSIPSPPPRIHPPAPFRYDGASSPDIPQSEIRIRHFSPMWQGLHAHDVVVDQFRASLKANRLASTYLFVGPEGIGKRTFALKLAKCLLCSESDAAALQPCGRCQSCTLCAAGTHPDIHVVQRRPDKKNLLVEQFIGIIDDADWFTPESANCLLKLLEEPPQGSLIILIGASRSRQLQTILSRSQIIRFHPLPQDVLAEMILAECLAPDAAAAQTLAERSGGSLALARDRSDPESFRMRELFAAAWRPVAQGTRGGFDPMPLAKPFDEFISRGVKEASARRERFRQVLLLAGDVLRDHIRAAAQNDSSPDAELAALDRCLEAEEQLDRNANQATLLECWLDDLAALA